MNSSLEVFGILSQGQQSRFVVFGNSYFASLIRNSLKIRNVFTSGVHTYLPTTPYMQGRERWSTNNSKEWGLPCSSKHILLHFRESKHKIAQSKFIDRSWFLKIRIERILKFLMLKRTEKVSTNKFRCLIIMKVRSSSYLLTY